MRLHKEKSLYIAGIGIVLAYALTRLIGILKLPIFTDEAIYVRWTQLASNDASMRFISLTDGKQPLLIWIGVIFLRFIPDPLLAVRLVSVCAGLFTMIGLYFLTKELFKDRKIALTASFLYIVFPFALVYDRLALYDSLLAAFAVWSLYLEVLLVRRKRLDIALIAAIVIGGGLLTKSSASFFIYLLPISLLLFDFNDKQKNKDLLKWAGLALVVVLGANAYYSVLRLSPFYSIIIEKNTTFVYPLAEWVKHPFSFFTSNIRVLINQLIAYSTIPLIFLATIAFFNKKFIREKLLLFSWFFVPFIALAFFGKVIFSRYIFFMTIPLLVLAAYSMVDLYKKFRPRYLKVLVVIAFILPMVYKDYYIINNFGKASIPSDDHSQLIAGYASGVGVRETIEFLKEKSSKQKIYVGTEGIFGLMPHSLQIYLGKNPNVEIKGFWPITDTIPAEVLSVSQKTPTYFIFYAPCPVCPQAGIAPASWRLKKVFQIPKISQETSYTLYQVMPQ